MPIPDFIVELRRHVGHATLWLPGVTAVVRRGAGAATELLLVRRADTGEWTPVTGIVDPAEEPGVAARRETLEETGVTATVDRLASIAVTDPVTYPNGDHAVYLDHTFACTWVSGEPYAADDESTAAGWFRLDALPPMGARYVERIEAALSDDPVARFRS